MLWLYRFLRGFVTVLFCGDYAEKILNLCVSHRITIWNSRLCKEGIKTNIYLKDIMKLRKIVRKSKVRVRIVKRCGLPFRLAKNKKRLGLFIGVVLLFAFLQTMSGFIWIIEVTGNNKVETKEILAACDKIGICEGIWADSINPKTCREKLLLGSDGLAWASLNIEGSRLTVNVTEISETTRDDTAPCNLKSSADGIIKKIDVTSGNCLVKVGDTVKSGDVLVSGVLEKADITQFVRSAGVITAETTRIFSSEGKFEKVIKEKTGKIKTKYALEFFTLKIPLFLGGETGEYETELEIKEAEFLEKSLPIRLYKRRFIYYESRTLKFSEEKLRAELEQQVMAQIETEGLENYTVSEFKEQITDGGIILSAEVTATENIAVEDALRINENG